MKGGSTGVGETGLHIGVGSFAWFIRKSFGYMPLSIWL